MSHSSRDDDESDLSVRVGMELPTPDSDTRMTATLLSRVVRVLQRYLWSGRHMKEFFNAAGLHVVPADFYSAVPSVDEIRNSFEDQGDAPPYLDPSVFDEPAMLELLDRLKPFAQEFSPPLDCSSGDENSGEFFWRNAVFSYSDVLLYYALIRQRRPRRIVEVGSGYSTLVAAAALDANGEGEILCIEPSPRKFLAGIPRVKEVFEAPAQSFSGDWFDQALQDGDFLFIDSTHTVKIGSDCLHLYLRALPAIQSKILVHAHDIFLPYGFPPDWALDHHYYWTEQYLLLAFLLQNPRYRVRLGSYCLHRRHPEALDALMDGRFERGGSSFWFEQVS